MFRVFLHLCHFNSSCNSNQFFDKKRDAGARSDLNPRVVCRILQELLLTRLAMGIVEREDDDVTMEKLDKALGELFEKKVMQGVPENEWSSVLLR